MLACISSSGSGKRLGVSDEFGPVAIIQLLCPEVISGFSVNLSEAKTSLSWLTERFEFLSYRSIEA